MATERKYSIEKVLGKGAFGKVFLVTDSEGKKYAKKEIMNVNNGNEPEKEVKAQKAACGHRNIVKIFDAFYDNDVFVIILEYCELGCLDDYIDVYKESVTSLRESFMIDMTRGVHHLHSLGIAHRDLKPANVLLVEGRDGNPVCKIADFGLVKMKKNANRTLDMNTFCGTQPFMAPEVTQTATAMYKRSCDVFSLGIVFYALISLKTLPLIDGKMFREAGHEAVQAKVYKVIQPEKHAKLVSQMLRFKAEDRPGAAMVLDLLGDSALAVSQEGSANIDAGAAASITDTDTDSHATIFIDLARSADSYEIVYKVLQLHKNETKLPL